MEFQPEQSNYKNLNELVSSIIKCKKCPRLRSYSEAVARNRPARFADWDYWAKPVPGFGDLNAKLLIIGLAPARSGANRTGRIFTGDASSRFLVAALHAAGFANQPISESIDDGLVYMDCYVTAAVKCVPPGDRPTNEEFENCSEFLTAELALMKNLRAVLALGAMAFDALRDQIELGNGARKLKFAHGKKYSIRGGPTLYASYHPSPRNTNTGRLTEAMLVSVLKKIRGDLERQARI